MRCLRDHAHPGAFALPATVAALASSHPQVSVHLEPTRDTDVLARLDAGQFDMAVISTGGAAPASGITFPAYHWHGTMYRIGASAPSQPASNRPEQRGMFRRGSRER